MEKAETRFAYDQKAALVKEIQDYRSLLDSTGLCINASRGIDSEALASILSALTGFSLSESALRETGERIWNLERMLIASYGINRSDDTLPQRFFDEPLRDGSARGAVLDRQRYDLMLSEYYEMRGWDTLTGNPLPATLKRLGIT